MAEQTSGIGSMWIWIVAALAGFAAWTFLVSDPSCDDGAVTAAQLIEERNRRISALLAGLGSVVSKPTMSQIDLVREGPDGSLVCTAVATTYRADTDKTSVETIGYIISEQTDGHRVQLLSTHQLARIVGPVDE